LYFFNTHKNLRIDSLEGGAFTVGTALQEQCNRIG